MKTVYTWAAALLILCLSSCTKSITQADSDTSGRWRALQSPIAPFAFCECTESGFMYARKTVYTDSVEWEYHSNAMVLNGVVGNYGSYSPHIFDLNSTGVVDANDINAINSGFATADTTVDICDFEIVQSFSHGWEATYPGTITAFLHPSVVDESELGTGACPLNTWWTERIYADSTVVEYWCAD